MLNTGDVFENPETPLLTYAVVRRMHNFDELKSVVAKMKFVHFDNLNVFNNQAVYPIFMVKTLVAMSEATQTPPMLWIVSNDHKYLQSIEVINGKVTTEQG